MIQTTKTLLAVLAIVLTVGFVAASGLTAQASALTACQGGLTILKTGNTVCVSQHAQTATGGTAPPPKQVIP